MGMKQEFLENMRTYVLLLLESMDLLKLKEMLAVYKILTSLEEDFEIEKNPSWQQSEQSALTNMKSLLMDEKQLKNQNLVCGMQKKEIFQKAILPGLQTVSQLQGVDLRSLIERVFKTG
jgi:hypothetical protein